MDLRQLTALIAVAEHGSFSAAARAIHTVQSNISTHIARLEKELDVTLVDRSSGRLTEEGEAALGRARRVIGEMDALASDVAALRDEVVGRVKVGVISTIGRWLVPDLLRALERRHPRVTTEFVDASTTSLLPLLRDSILDIAIVNLPVVDTDISAEPLFEEERVLVVPSDHELAGRTSVSIAEAARYPLILEPRGTAFRDELDDAAAAAGVTLEAQAEVDGMLLVASLAFRGFGVAVLPATAAPDWLSGDWTKVLVDGPTRRTVGIARRRDGRLAAPARAFHEVLLDTIVEFGPKQTGVHLSDGLR